MYKPPSLLSNRSNDLQSDTEKLNTWKVKTELGLKEGEARLQRCSGETDSQQQQLVVLQKNNERLRSEVRQLTQEKQELSGNVQQMKGDSDLLASQCSQLSSQLEVVLKTQSDLDQLQSRRRDQFEQMVNR